MYIETHGSQQYLDLIAAVDEGGVIVEVNANRALTWLMQHPEPRRFAVEKAFAFNYIQWLILLPGIVAIFLIPLIPALIVLAATMILAVVVTRIKSQLLRSGVTSFIRQDAVSLDELYQAGAVWFRKKGEKEKDRLVRFPQSWTHVIDKSEVSFEGDGAS